MKNIFIIFCLFILVSCNSDENTTKTSQISSYIDNQTAIGKFSAFLKNSDTTDVESISKALKYFNVNFEKESDTICDSAYFLFERLYSKINQHLDNKLMDDTTDYNIIYRLDKNKKPYPVPTHIKNYVNALKRNGYYLESDGEGGLYVEYDRDLINKYFLPKVSPAMKKYLQEIAIETYEGFAADAALIITEEQYAKRLLFWEKFLSDYPNFYDNKFIEKHQKSELTFLFTGVDNTPLMEYDSENTINPYYKNLFELIEKKNSSGKIANTLRPFYQALFRKDTATANKIKKEMQAKGIIENYEY